MFTAAEEICIAALSSKVVFVDECIPGVQTPASRIAPIDLFNLFTADIIRGQTVFYR